MLQTHEKRQTLRAPLDAEVLYTIDGQEWRRTRSRDVSATGMLLWSHEPVVPGQQVILRFRLPNLQFQEAISARAEVMRVIVRQGSQAGFGLRFISLSAGQFQVVEEFVGRILGLPEIRDMQKHGQKSPQGDLTFVLERLVRESEEHRAASEIRKVALAEDRGLGLFSGRFGWDAAFKALGALLVGLVFFFLTSWFVNLLQKLTDKGP